MQRKNEFKSLENCLMRTGYAAISGNDRGKTSQACLSPVIGSGFRLS